MRASPSPWRVVWSGDGMCRSLAETLAEPRPVRASSDVWTSLVEARASLYVARQLPSFERCSVAVPHDVDLSRVTGVVAAVGGGPHSILAAATASRISDCLNVPAEVLTGYRTPDQRPHAEQAMWRIGAAGIQLPMRAVQTEHPPELVAALPPGCLVVIGAPGGSWFQRQLFGAGRRLQTAAPAGVVVVRHDEPRVYQEMTAVQAVGVHMRVRDALTLTDEAMVLVADHGRLVGMVDRTRLAELEPHLELGEVAEPAVALAPGDSLEQARSVLAEHGGGPLGVVDRNGMLIGAMAQRKHAMALRRQERRVS